MAFGSEQKSEGRLDIAQVAPFLWYLPKRLIDLAVSLTGVLPPVNAEVFEG